MPFKKGDPRPAGAGMPTGKTTAKVVARGREYEEAMEEIRADSVKYQDMPPEEIAKALKFDPIVAAIHMYNKEHVKDETKVKLLETVASRLYPTLKAVETKVEQDTTMRVVWGSNAKNNAAIIEQTIHPAINTRSMDDDEDDVE